MYYYMDSIFINKLRKLIFYLAFLPSIVFAQAYKNSISGFIYDKTTNLPIENANVYISNTILGSPTDENGYYYIESIPKSTHELVVSVIGYNDTSKTIIVNKNSILKYNFKLTPKIYATDPISITATALDEWEDNLDLFKEKFIGKFIFSKKCYIDNEEVLDFDNSKSFLTATASRPLIIYNYALGYKINCIIKEFSWNILDNRWGWQINTEFREIPPDNEEQKLEWQKNRDIAYRNSIHHFLSSLINDRTEDDGYRLNFTLYAVKKKETDPLSMYPVFPNLVIKKGLIETDYIFHFQNYLQVIDTKSENTDKISWIKLNYDRITLDEFGYPQEKSPYRVYGFWAKLGISDLLPKYYNLE